MMKVMSVPIDIVTLEEIVASIDKLLAHITSQQGISQQDVIGLRKVIFHLDSLIVKLKNNSDQNSTLYVSDLTRFLSQAAEHLRRVLADAELAQYQHPTAKHQQSNDHWFATMIDQMRKL